MVCDCCGRRKKIFESFAAVKYGQTQMNFCVDCNDLAYKIRDDANEQNSDSYEKHLKEWKKRASFYLGGNPLTIDDNALYYIVFIGCPQFKNNYPNIVLVNKNAFKYEKV